VTQEPRFRPYSPADRGACLGLFDDNCPAFFAPNERDDYVKFLATEAGRYEVCLLGHQVVGAYGLGSQDAAQLALRWILISTRHQGQGLGSAIMARVLAVVRAEGANSLYIGASHKSAPFFARFGARETATTLNGWGPDMHRVDMELAIRP
jgi:GNAT superfamily N-acetyltransferase